MASITPNPETIRDFPNAAAFERWLKANHNKATELWLKIHKKGSGLAALDKAPKAKAHFAKLNSANRYAICFRLHNTKTAAARVKKLAEFIAMLAKGQQIHPQ
ncbi:MAG: YdeI/OmpD-associated family protein [Deltaproteobacteria bacterium]|nr:YdeI/OmpD-associated family protein [Deltaproteobacteria bacterium]